MILPITDPYVVHHGSLGSFATIYLDGGAGSERVQRELAALPGVEYVAGREEACSRFGLPGDRLGDLVVVSGAHTVLGKSPEAHDLSALGGVLRSHGRLAEQKVPFVLNVPLNEAYREKAAVGLRNFEISDCPLNGSA